VAISAAIGAGGDDCLLRTGAHATVSLQGGSGGGDVRAMKEFLDTAAAYQHYWLPLAVGMIVGVLMIATGNIVLRRRPKPSSPNPTPTPGGPNYDPFTQGSPSDQRRAFRRQGNLVHVRYRLAHDNSPILDGLVLDRSVTGVRLGLDAEVPPGTRFLLLPAGASELTPWTEVEVRTCRPIEDSWEAGCQFVKVPPWSVLLLFG
jgi:hypothetical protein